MHRPILRSIAIILFAAVHCILPERSQCAESEFIDCSLLVSPEYPCTWPSYPFPRFQIIHERTIGPVSPYNVDVLIIDGNTGTQMDVPPHSVARPELNRPKSGPFGLSYTDKIEPWQFGGEACIIDARTLLDQAAKGVSPLITRKYVEEFEKLHRPLKFGDVVLFFSGYTNKYYRPYPAGQRFVADVVSRQAPGFPDPDPDCMEAVADRGVMTAGTDSASLGPMPDLAEPTHYAGLRHGMIWTESAAQLGELPPTGAFYCMLGPKHAGSHVGECRAFAIRGGELPQQLIDSCRAKRAIDLSPTLAVEMPVTSPGVGVGRHRQVYLKVDIFHDEYLDMWHHTHLMDSMSGTHLVPPAYSLPSNGASVAYAPEVRGWLEEFERDYGPRGTSTMTTEQVPIEWTCGPARVINVEKLVGSTKRQDWPASPEITPEHIRRIEDEQGQIQAGDIVVFRTGHLDRTFKAAPNDKDVWMKPLAGESEGWPALGPAAVEYLHKRGVRCVAIDAPDLGGVEPRRALMTYWALGSRQMVGVEFLVNVGQIPKNAYFLFAAIKIDKCHGGPGRAIALY